MSIYIISIFAIVLGVAFDQFTKYLAVKHLKDGAIPIIEGVFELQYLENRGAAFGMLQNRQGFFLIIGAVLLVLFAFMYVKMPRTKRYLPLRICVIAITAGAIGNMIDRAALNYVVDFLYFKLIDFPIFNVADIYVTCATFLLIFLILFYYKEDELDALFQIFSRKSDVKKES